MRFAYWGKLRLPEPCLLLVIAAIVGRKQDPLEPGQGFFNDLACVITNLALLNLVSSPCDSTIRLP